MPKNYKAILVTGGDWCYLLCNVFYHKTYLTYYYIVISAYFRATVNQKEGSGVRYMVPSKKAGYTPAVRELSMDGHLYDSICTAGDRPTLLSYSEPGTTQHCFPFDPPLPGIVS